MDRALQYASDLYSPATASVLTSPFRRTPATPSNTPVLLSRGPASTLFPQPTNPQPTSSVHNSTETSTPSIESTTATPSSDAAGHSQSTMTTATTATMTTPSSTTATDPVHFPASSGIGSTGDSNVDPHVDKSARLWLVMADSSSVWTERIVRTTMTLMDHRGGDVLHAVHVVIDNPDHPDQIVNEKVSTTPVEEARGEVEFKAAAAEAKITSRTILSRMNSRSSSTAMLFPISLTNRPSSSQSALPMLFSEMSVSPTSKLSNPFGASGSSPTGTSPLSTNPVVVGSNRDSNTSRRGSNGSLPSESSTLDSTTASSSSGPEGNLASLGLHPATSGPASSGDLKSDSDSDSDSDLDAVSDSDADDEEIEAAVQRVLQSGLGGGGGGCGGGGCGGGGSTSIPQPVSQLVPQPTPPNPLPPRAPSPIVSSQPQTQVPVGLLSSTGGTRSPTTTVSSPLVSSSAQPSSPKSKFTTTSTSTSTSTSTTTSTSASSAARPPPCHPHPSSGHLLSSVSLIGVPPTSPTNNSPPIQSLSVSSVSTLVSGSPIIPSPPTSPSEPSQQPRLSSPPPTSPPHSVITTISTSPLRMRTLQRSTSRSPTSSASFFAGSFGSGGVGGTGSSSSGSGSGSGGGGHGPSISGSLSGPVSMGGGSSNYAGPLHHNSHGGGGSILSASPPSSSAMISGSTPLAMNVDSDILTPRRITYNVMNSSSCYSVKWKSGGSRSSRLSPSTRVEDLAPSMQRVQVAIESHLAVLQQKYEQELQSCIQAFRQTQQQLQQAFSANGSIGGGLTSSSSSSLSAQVSSSGAQDTDQHVQHQVQSKFDDEIAAASAHHSVAHVRKLQRQHLESTEKSNGTTETGTVSANHSGAVAGYPSNLSPTSNSVPPPRQSGVTPLGATVPAAVMGSRSVLTAPSLRRSASTANGNFASASPARSMALTGTRAFVTQLYYHAPVPVAQSNVVPALLVASETGTLDAVNASSSTSPSVSLSVFSEECAATASASAPVIATAPPTASNVDNISRWNRDISSLLVTEAEEMQPHFVVIGAYGAGATVASNSDVDNLDIVPDLKHDTKVGDSWCRTASTARTGTIASSIVHRTPFPAIIVRGRMDLDDILCSTNGTSAKILVALDSSQSSWSALRQSVRDLARSAFPLPSQWHFVYVSSERDQSAANGSEFERVRGQLAAFMDTLFPSDSGSVNSESSTKWREVWMSHLRCTPILEENRFHRKLESAEESTATKPSGAPALGPPKLFRVPTAVETRADLFWHRIGTTICEYARDIDAHFLVIGSTGSRLERAESGGRLVSQNSASSSSSRRSSLVRVSSTGSAPFGRVAQYCIDRSPCSVVVYKTENSNSSLEGSLN